MDRLELFKKRIAALPVEGEEIPRKGGFFSAKSVWADNGQLVGVEVDNLGEYPFLSMDVFAATISLLEQSTGCARKGQAMSGRLGDIELSLDSVEGRVAVEVYRKQLGETVFRRITPVSRLLEWAGICKSINGSLCLADRDYC